ncbi:hypothetical protein [Caulobacter sp.]|uniref:hypothetical protein n=1 Tax=Caulobacter sp. TaxID=78 RepID=UPI003BAB66AE
MNFTALVGLIGLSEEQDILDGFIHVAAGDEEAAGIGTIVDQDIVNAILDLVGIIAHNGDQRDLIT